MTAFCICCAVATVPAVQCRPQRLSCSVADRIGRGSDREEVHRARQLVHHTCHSQPTPKASDSRSRCHPARRYLGTPPVVTPMTPRLCMATLAIASDRTRCVTALLMPRAEPGRSTLARIDRFRSRPVSAPHHACVVNPQSKLPVRFRGRVRLLRYPVQLGREKSIRERLAGRCELILTHCSKRGWRSAGHGESGPMAKVA